MARDGHYETTLGAKLTRGDGQTKAQLKYCLVDALEH